MPVQQTLIGSSASAETKARLVVWLLMIRSRLQALGIQVIWGRYHDRIGYSIRRPHSPIDTVLRVWMEGVVIGEVGIHEEQPLLRTLIDILLHESHVVNDYRQLFPFLSKRINAHVKRLLQDTEPLVIGEMVFVDVVQ